MGTHRLRSSIRMSSENGLGESDAVKLSRFAREFVCDLHVTCGDWRADAKSQSEMIELARGSCELIGLEAEGVDSQLAIAFFTYFLLNELEPVRDEMALNGLASRSAGKPDGRLSIGSLSPREALDAFALIAAKSGQEPCEYGSPKAYVM